MAEWNQPPIAKVYEALSAVADGRVTLTGETSAKVVSSGGDKTYTVKWSAAGREITSDDNATRWQGYIGYPIIAVLLQTGRLAYDSTAARSLAGVPWKALNERYKRDYDAAVEQVLGEVRAAGGDADRVRTEANRLHIALAELKLERPVSKREGSGKRER